MIERASKPTVHVDGGVARPYGRLRRRESAGCLGPNSAIAASGPDRRA